MLQSLLCLSQKMKTNVFLLTCSTTRCCSYFMNFINFARLKASLVVRVSHLGGSTIAGRMFLVGHFLHLCHYSNLKIQVFRQQGNKYNILPPIAHGAIREMPRQQPIKPQNQRLLYNKTNYTIYSPIKQCEDVCRSPSCLSFFHLSVFFHNPKKV